MTPGDTFAVIGGSGAHKVLASAARNCIRVDPLATPFGESAAIYRMRVGDAHFLFLPRHGEEGCQVAAPWVNYRANLYALKECGVTRIVSWSGPGATDTSLHIGQFVIPNDLIDETRNRESSFYKGTGLGSIRQTPVFCPELRDAAERALRMLRLGCREHGVYVCTEGPRLETPAEIRRYRKDGADLVGMTLCPEVFLARELEMCYAVVCYVASYAEGVHEREVRPGVLPNGLIGDAEREAIDESLSRFLEIACLILRNLPDDHHCACGLSMERYRKEGRIGDDWHTWIGKP